MSFELVYQGDTAPLDRLQGYLTTFDENALKIFKEVAEETFNEIRGQMLEALRYYPPVPAGSTYVRTFRLKRGFQLTLEIAGSSVAVVVRNPTPYTRYVVGTLTTVDAAARATQRAFHARNGWIVTLVTTRFWFDQYKDAFIEAFIDAIIADVRKRI